MSQTAEHHEVLRLIEQARREAQNEAGRFDLRQQRLGRLEWGRENPYRTVVRDLDGLIQLLRSADGD